MPTDVAALKSWENFYVIVGSAAAALTGLQFVVMALIHDFDRGGVRSDIDAFGTPTILHFSVTLLVSALVSAPWPTIESAAIALALCGAGGIAYMLVVWRRARHAHYKPVFEDWMFHVALPFASYGTLLGAAMAVASTVSRLPLFGVAVATLGLLFVGIHNAWDTVTYIVADGGGQRNSD